MEIKIRDLRKKDQYKIDDAYLNGYARLCGVYATAVYNSLSRHADFHTQECFPSIETIAEQHNISKPTVIKAIQELLKWDIISVIKEKDSKTKRQKSNVYILMDKSQWKDKPSKGDLPRAESTSEQKPSKPDDKSRVNQIDCKDTQYKDTHSKESRYKRFIPPSLEEVRNYCLERKNTINPQNFIDFYISKGWLIGKNKMKDWRAAVRTWENRNKSDGKTNLLRAEPNKYDKYN